MAIQAERHAQRLGLRHFVHLVDLAMTMEATDAAVHMDRVIEINEVRHLVDLHPRNVRVVGGCLPDRREAIVRREHLVVAIHTDARPGMFEYQDLSTSLWQ
jgi:hypothetical protein